MPFDPKSARKAGQKSKRGPAKKIEPGIQQKMEMLYEKVLDDLLQNQDKLTKTERVKLFVTLSCKLPLFSTVYFYNSIQFNDFNLTGTS